MECWRRRYASFLHLKLDELSDIDPHTQEHRVTARKEIPLGALLCGTDLATCYRGAASLFFHSPNTVQTLPVLPYVSSRASLRGHYSWNALDLLTHRLEGLVFLSVLLAYRSSRLSAQPHLDPPVNFVLHFLGNGLSCGEAIRTIARGETLIRHWDLGEYQWRRTDNYLDCLRHDVDDTRPDRTKWYSEKNF